ncbi:uncharacterized protein TNCV_4122711 [Trichonephila clavipes]|nr:uncharacterized protein TNCV_4122711 [Trichonephila clavipes]
MPRASTKVFKKRRGVFNKGRCNKSNDGCGESNSTVPKNSADEKNCADGQSFVLMKLNHLPKCDSSENYELNTRLVYAMRCIGKGAESARMFCGIMNLPPPPTKFSKYNHILLQVTRETCEHSMAEAVREAVDENDGKRDVAVDGSWQKRGFSSKNGLLTVTSVDTGKVIDVEVLSKHCICPNKTKHLQNCKRNFEGYSGKMEVAGALSIFQRFQSLYNVRYTKYLGDGDSKAFTSIVENKVYGDHCSVEKLECIGHVMKRMGTRLRRLKTKMRGQKPSDGKPLCGRNRLTEAEIDRLQAYYGLAIRRNLSSVKDMQQAIWAIFLHKLSIDEKPQHGFCPSDSDTWCKFKKAELLGETYHHKNSLPVDVVEAMRPVFRDLANPELLKKCLHGGTQNPNESVNNVIWSRVPKKTFVQLEVLSLGTYDAVSSFNMGNVSKLEILRKMCIEPGDYTVQAMECLDKQRLLRAKYYCLQKTKEVRKEKRLKRKKEDDELLKNADDLEYGAKMF